MEKTALHDVATVSACETQVPEYATAIPAVTLLAEPTNSTSQENKPVDCFGAQMALAKELSIDKLESELKSAPNSLSLIVSPFAEQFSNMEKMPEKQDVLTSTTVSNKSAAT